jgi:hypothetical protein
MQVGYGNQKATGALFDAERTASCRGLALDYPGDDKRR